MPNQNSKSLASKGASIHGDRPPEHRLDGSAAVPAAEVDAETPFGRILAILGDERAPDGKVPAKVVVAGRAAAAAMVGKADADAAIAKRLPPTDDPLPVGKVGETADANGAETALVGGWDAESLLDELAMSVEDLATDAGARELVQDEADPMRAAAPEPVAAMVPVLQDADIAGHEIDGLRSATALLGAPAPPARVAAPAGLDTGPMTPPKPEILSDETAVATRSLGTGQPLFLRATDLAHLSQDTNVELPSGTATRVISVEATPVSVAARPQPATDRFSPISQVNQAAVAPAPVPAAHPDQTAISGKTAQLLAGRIEGTEGGSAVGRVDVQVEAKPVLSTAVYRTKPLAGNQPPTVQLQQTYSANERPQLVGERFVATAALPGASAGAISPGSNKPTMQDVPVSERLAAAAPTRAAAVAPAPVTPSLPPANTVNQPKTQAHAGQPADPIAASKPAQMVTPEVPAMATANLSSETADRTGSLVANSASISANASVFTRESPTEAIRRVVEPHVVVRGQARVVSPAFPNGAFVRPEPAVAALAEGLGLRAGPAPLPDPSVAQVAESSDVAKPVERPISAVTTVNAAQIVQAAPSTNVAEFIKAVNFDQSVDGVFGPTRGGEAGTPGGEARLSAVEGRGQSSSTSPPNTHASVRDVPVRIVKALGDGAARLTVTLRPQELGTLSIRMHFVDGRLTVDVAADRPETLHLLQREADGFERGLRQAGLDLREGGLHFGSQGDPGRQRAGGAPGWNGMVRPGDGDGLADADDDAPAQAQGALDRSLILARSGRDALDIRA